MKNTKSIIIITLLLAICIMAVGYSAFATQLSLNGTAEIIGEWNVRIVKVEAIQVSEGCDPGELQFTNTSVSFNAKLLKPGDTITYVVTIENAGTIDAKLDYALFKQDEEPEEINYSTSELTPVLEAGSQLTFTVKVAYNSKVTELPEVKTKGLTGIVEFVQV